MGTESTATIHYPDDEGYVLLWDLADELSKKSRKTPEWHWLRLIDGFWEGKLAPNGIGYFWRVEPEPGLQWEIFTRDELAQAALGSRSFEEGDRWQFEPRRPVEAMRAWRVADYLAIREPYGEYFKRDPERRCGLAVRRQEFEKYMFRPVRPGTAIPAARPAEQKSGTNDVAGPEAVVPGTDAAWKPRGPAPKVPEIQTSDQLRSATSPRPAPESIIHEMITKVYDAATQQGVKPPNVKEVSRPVLKLLGGEGYTASHNRIQQLAGDRRYAERRRKPGLRVRGTLRAFSALEI